MINLERGVSAIIAILQHYLNPLHIYCRLRDLGLAKAPAAFFCRVYDQFLFRYFVGKHAEGEKRNRTFSGPYKADYWLIARVEQIDMRHSPLGTRYRDIVGRRSGVDNRQFSYNCHVPERRLKPDRRTNPKRRSGLDRRSTMDRRSSLEPRRHVTRGKDRRCDKHRRTGLERRALPSPLPDDRVFDKGYA